MHESNVAFLKKSSGILRGQVGKKLSNVELRAKRRNQNKVQHEQQTNGKILNNARNMYISTVKSLFHLMAMAIYVCISFSV